MPLTSQLFRGDAALEAAANVDSAHITPGARGPHVAKIQTALNILEQGGLTTDGAYGPATATAVLNFKTKRDIVNRAYQTKADDIVGKMTMVALDAAMAANGGAGASFAPVGFSQHFACDHVVQGSKKKSGGASDLELPDPSLAALAVSMVPKLRFVIRSTQTLLASGGRFIHAHQKLVEPQGHIETEARKCIHLLKNVFSIDQLASPRAGYDNIVRVFFNMNVALNRSFAPNLRDPSVLFVPNRHTSMEHVNAYTVPRGAFKEEDDRIAGINEPASRIYICNHFTTYSEIVQVGILLHEMAHFVSGQPIVIDHINGVPKKGHMLTNRAPFDIIKPVAKLQSPEHYAFFALAAGHKAFEAKD